MVACFEFEAMALKQFYESSTETTICQTLKGNGELGGKKYPKPLNHFQIHFVCESFVKGVRAGSISHYYSQK